MKSFSISKPITSCKVTKEVIEKCEDYLASQAVFILNIDEQEAKDTLKVKVVDGYGSAEMGSIKDEPFTKFSDDTSKVSIEFIKIKDQKYFSVNIRFNKESTLSEININIEHENSREIAIGFYQSFIKLLEPFTTINRFFHPPALIDGILFSLILTIWTGIIVTSINKMYTTSAIMFVFGIVVTFYIMLGKKARPYTGFDSKSLDNKDKWWDWFVKRMIGFIVFSAILGTLLKVFSKQLFGS